MNEAVKVKHTLCGNFRMLEMSVIWAICRGKPQAMSGAKREARWADNGKSIGEGLHKLTGAYVLSCVQMPDMEL
jgi:hypothetical protein